MSEEREQLEARRHDRNTSGYYDCCGYSRLMPHWEHCPYHPNNRAARDAQ